MSIETESFAAIHEKYSKAIDWMVSIGVKLRTNRLDHYDRVVGAWAKNYKTASVEEGKEVFPDFVSSVVEIRDFVDVYSAFKDIPKERLTAIISKLNKGVNGPTNAVDETPKSTQARNYLFEAATAARLHRPESGVEAILDAESDTAARIGVKKVWIECKRVTTTDRIEDNFRKATKQLEAILKKKVGAANRAMVALDISKILNEGGEILVKDTEAELLSSVDWLMDQFIRQYHQVWEKVYRRRDKKIIGTLIRFSFISSVEDRKLLVHTSQWGVNPRLGVSVADGSLQKELCGKMKQTP
jgi:hypothetical protein